MARRMPKDRRMTIAEETVELINELNGYEVKTWTPDQWYGTGPEPVRIYVKHEGDDIGYVRVQPNGELEWNGIIHEDLRGRVE